MILPRLTELFKRLLNHPWQADFRRHAPYIQVAISVICAGLLREGLPNAKFSCVYCDETCRKETTRFSEFRELQQSKTISDDTYMRAQARKLLQEEVAEWKKKYHDLLDRNREGVDLQKMKTLENRRDQDLQKIAELEKQQISDHQKNAKLENERDKVSVIELL